MSAMLDQLNTRRLTIWNESKELLDRVQAEGRDFTSAEAATFDKHAADMDTCATRITQLERTERTDREVEETLLRTLGPGGAGSGTSFGASPFAAAGSSWLPSRRGYEDAVVEQRATGFSNAGAVLSTAQFGQYFDKLRTASVVLSAGPRLIPVDGRSISIPVLTGSATVSNVAENTPITASDPTLAAISLTPLKFAALVNASNESISDSNPALLSIISDDLIATASTAIDSALLTGPGTAGTIRGLKSVVGATQVPFGANDGALVTIDGILDLISGLEALGSKLSDLAVFCSPQVWSVIRKQKASTAGTYLVQGDLSQPAPTTLFGVRIFPTGNLPQSETRGTATSICSTVLVADMSRIAVAVGLDTTVQMSSDFLFSSDATSIRLTSRLDLAALNANAVVVAVGAKVA